MVVNNLHEDIARQIRDRTICTQGVYFSVLTEPNKFAASVSGDGKFYSYFVTRAGLSPTKGTIFLLSFSLRFEKGRRNRERRIEQLSSFIPNTYR